MANIIPFESKQLPSFLANAGKPVNDDLSTGVGGGFKSLSIKGKVFAVVAGKERTTIMNPADEDEAASSLEVVLLKANKTISKVWYAKEWNDGDEASKPDCFSNDGVAPDKESTDPQSKSCATCKWNAFGSSKNGKGKACSDSRRVAVAAPDHLNEPMMLRVPAASLKPLAEFGRTLAARGVPYSSVVAKLRFELDEATPKLIFKPVGFLTDSQYQQAQAMAESEVVGQIIGTVPFAAHADDDQFETKKAAPTSKKEVEVPKPAPKPVAKKVAPVVQEPVEEVEEEAPAKPEVKKSAAKAPSMVDDLDALLMELDG